MGLASLGFVALQVDPPDWVNYVMVPFMSPWLGPPSAENKWVVPAAAAWLVVLFFLSTVWMERRYVAWRTGLPSADISRWSWQANILSYLAIEVLLVGRIVWLLRVG